MRAKIVLTTSVIIIITMIIVSSQGYCLSELKRLELLPRVEVARNNVYLGDLIQKEGLPEDWRIRFDSLFIGEAPGPGTIKYVQLELLKEYLKKIIASNGQDPDRVIFLFPDQVMIVRKTVTLPRDEIEKHFREFVLKNAPWKPSEIKISNIRYAGLPVVPAGKRRYEIIASQNEHFIGNVAVTMNIYVDGKRSRSLRVAGIVDLYRPVLHAKAIISKGKVVTAEDLEIKRARVTDAPEDFTDNFDIVVGKRALTDIFPGEPLRLSRLDNPIVVQKGDIVKILLQKPGLTVTARGKAKEDGHIGDTVKVINLSSKKVIFCRVRSKDLVQVID